jgi:hypothetical protein
MRILILLFSALLLTACAGTGGGPSNGSGTPEQWDVPLDAAEQDLIAEVEREGQTLYRKDQYAAQATRALLAALDLADYPDIIGWVGYERGQDYVVTFYERSSDEISLIADIHFGANDEYNIEIEPDRVISDEELSMLDARTAAIEDGFNSCSDRFNSVVMPIDTDEEAWVVYILAATTNPNAIVVGGHSRIRVDKHTNEVLEVEALSSSCLTLDKSKLNAPGSEGAMILVTHRASPMPTPIHPFLSLLHQRPVIVLSERGHWVVNGSSISMHR